MSILSLLRHAMIFSHVRVLGVLCLVCFLLHGCAALESAPAPQKALDPAGLTGDVVPEAERLFAKADVLWQGKSQCASPEQSLNFLDAALKLEPNYAKALVRRAMALIQLGYFDDALDDASKAVRLYGGADAYAVRGLAHIKLGNMLGAERDLDRAMGLKAAPYMLQYVGLLAQTRGNTLDACAAYGKACAQGLCESLDDAQREGLCK